MEIGSPVLTQISSGIIVGETSTHWTIVGFDGRYESGPLNVQKLRKGSKYPTPFEVSAAVIVSQLINTYERAFPQSQRKKSELAHRLLLQHLGQEEISMATAKKTPQPVKKAAAPKAEKKATAPKAEKKAVAPKAAAPKKEGIGRKGAFSSDMKIKVLVEGNPKRAKAAERFALYKNGITVAEYLAAGGTMADVRWDVKQEFISVS